MTTVSAIPGMLAALYALATTSFAGTAVTVVSGPPTLVPAGTSEAFVVGAAWDPDEASSARSTLEPFSDSAQLETIEVPGVVMVKTGDPDVTAPTLRAFQMLATFKALLLADPTLGGVVGYAQDAGGGGKAEADSLAQFTSVELVQGVSGGGRCVVAFTVGAAALIPD